MMERGCNIRGVLVLQSLPFSSDNNKLTTTQEHSYVATILTRESNDFNLKLMESLLIVRDKLVLNKAGFSLPLELF